MRYLEAEVQSPKREGWIGPGESLFQLHDTYMMWGFWKND